ncbi:hypothetical protein, partial [Klebsiella pneumoniae]|uniref:hypothetical protein n=1 Tax=Klebsiella pneumoniae TaxID=573 RepID=UPI0011DDD65C
KACVLPENPASYRVVRTKSYLFNKARHQINFRASAAFLLKTGKACLMHRVGYIETSGAQRHLQSVPVYRKAFPMITVQLSLIEYRSFMAR